MPDEADKKKSIPEVPSPEVPSPEVSPEEPFGIVKSYTNLREDLKDFPAHRFFLAFSEAMGIPDALIRTEFKKYIQDFAKGIYPNLHCSSLRAVLEGRIPGVPIPVQPVPPMRRTRVELILFLADLSETLVQEYISKRIKSLKDDRRVDEMRVVQDVLGTSKVPSVLDALMKGGDPNAKRKQKAAQRDEGSSSRREHARNPKEGR